ncbi:hypothetical protein [Nonomuraea recticatena]|uniref:hypothetical protein n=1 Tax=Nonomuraea recticatena TaxID=46178 RepID=UPI00361FE608
MMEFTQWIRERTDDQLGALVSARPELITPVPAHLEGLAARAGSPSAIGRALDRLDRFALAVVETLAVHPDELTKDSLHDLLARATGEDDLPLDDTLERLRALALVYGPDGALALAPGVRKVLDDPAGLGPPVTEVFRHHPPEQLEEIADDIAPGTEGGGKERLRAALAEPAKLVEEVSPPARKALEELAWGPPSGRVPNARRAVRLATARSPIEELLARGCSRPPEKTAWRCPARSASTCAKAACTATCRPCRRPSRARSVPAPSPTGRRRARRSRSRGRSRSCARGGASTLPACCARAASGCATSSAPPPSSTCPNGPPPWSSRWHTRRA